MVRKQIYIEEDTERALKKMARRSKTSEARLIRDALGLYIASHLKEDPENPLLDIIGLAKGTLTDASVRHDELLYGGQEG